MLHIWTTLLIILMEYHIHLVKFYQLKAKINGVHQESLLIIETALVSQLLIENIPVNKKYLLINMMGLLLYCRKEQISVHQAITARCKIKTNI